MKSKIVTGVCAARCQGFSKAFLRLIQRIPTTDGFVPSSVHAYDAGETTVRRPHNERGGARRTGAVAGESSPRTAGSSGDKRQTGPRGPTQARVRW